MNWHKFDALSERIGMACVTLILVLMAAGFLILGAAAAYAWVVNV